MQTGDIVTRNSYHNDIHFIVEHISDNKVQLSGLNYRLSADAVISDLSLSSITQETPAQIKPPSPIVPPHLTSTNIEKVLHKKEPLTNGKCFVKTLHIDSNKHYLKECMKLYNEIGIPVIGYQMSEDKQPKNILHLLTQYRPNILVITGHDSVSKSTSDLNSLNSYANSKYFVESVKIARNYKSNYDDLVIIAGGCKSCYEALINEGANFASSPSRVMINVTEPVLIACKIATTSIRQIVTMDAIATVLPSGLSGFGGIETRGQCRIIKPYINEI